MSVTNDITINKVLLSVVIPVYNGELFISDCLESVHYACKQLTAESGGVTEIICVDDGSSDNSAGVIESWLADVTLLRQEKNAGFAPTCNRGLSVANGEYLYLLNQDTRSHPESIVTLYNKLRSEPRLGIVGPKFVAFDGRLQHECRSLPTYENVFYEMTGLARLFPLSRRIASLRLRWFNHQNEMFVEQPMGAALMFRRSLLEEVGSLDESFPIFFNDVDWARRILDAGYVNLYCPSAVVEHFIGSATKPQKPKMIRESHQALYHYFEKWHEKGNVWGNAWNRALLFVWRIGLTFSGVLRSWYWALWK